MGSVSSSPPSGDFGRRTRSAILFVTVFLAALLTGPWPFAAFLGLAAVVAAWEGGRLLQAMGASVGPLLLLLGPLALVGGLLLPASTLLPVVLAGYVLLVGWLWRPVALNRVPGGPIGGLILASIYVGLFPSFLIRLHAGPWQGAGLGPWEVLLLVFLIWAADTGAYVVGSRFGRHRLWQAVSPKKSWEGLAGAAIFAVGVGVLLSRTPWFALSTPLAAQLGLVAAVLATVGDLFESRWKRVAGVKDSGTLIPGHGGVLDRFDSLFFTAPLFYYYLHQLPGRF